MKTIKSKNQYGHLEGSALNFINFSGKTLEDRFCHFDEWISNRYAHKVMPFAKAWKPNSLIKRDRSKYEILNFGMSDYLGLASHEALLKTAQEAGAKYGIHCPSSQSLTGRTELNELLENKLSDLLETETTMLFSTGWMAGFGALAGLTNSKDTIVMDKLAHNCLQSGACFASQKIHKFNHNDLEHLEMILHDCREKDPKNGIFVVTETLFSMNADAPDLPALFSLIDKYEAILIIDIVHDFVANGEFGLGLLETISLKNRKNVVLVGSFSKTMGTNGGFIAGPWVIRHQIMFTCPSYVFSTGISTLQCAIALKAIDIAFSQEGQVIRKRMNHLVEYALEALHKAGFQTDGNPCAIIPVVIGSEKKARLMSREIEDNNLVINLVEFPAVPKSRAIFRLLLMATHTENDIDRMVQILSSARQSVEEPLNQLTTEGAR